MHLHPKAAYLPFLKLLLFLSIFLISCGSEEEKATADSVEKLTADLPAIVEVETLRKTNFNQETISNGHISSASLVTLKFNMQEIIKDVYVANGSMVSKDQKIAELESYTLQKSVEQAKTGLARAYIEYQDLLIGQGYKADNVESASKELKDLAKIKSGVNAAQTQYDLAQYALKHATLRSPISGKVINLFAKAKTMSTGEQFCQVIDVHNMEVTFPLMESEVYNVKIGNQVRVVPFSSPNLSFNGVITEINPTVDEKGTIRVRAKVNYDPLIIDGMNVHVNIKNRGEMQITVPKDAVVERTGRQVVFSLSHGKAVWNYVTAKLENENEYSIQSETLHVGDTIITKGNLTLAHESPVKVISHLERQPN
ncbi:efflux RND transporter periplasmic adaptor subunit [Mucilaginibacter sp. UYCu711]|uniref:efflux RND transporter periplasmic adaptor subunit n=1 Tax=Mucilaginibacter sp. UYCu711 TaxID=3156339 RepID=UPI003D206BF3